MTTSLFDLYKLGVGPSSFHTMGPIRAAHRFAFSLVEHSLLDHVVRVRAELYGSLALTGKGHATDRAVLLGQVARSSLLCLRPEISRVCATCMTASSAVKRKRRTNSLCGRGGFKGAALWRSS